MEKPAGIDVECVSLGPSMKVCAVDRRTGIEVAIVGAASEGAEQLTRNALDKLTSVLSRQAHAEDTDGVLTSVA